MSFRTIMLAYVILLTVTYLAMLMIGNGYKLEMVRIIKRALGVFMIIAGNELPRLEMIRVTEVKISRILLKTIYRLMMLKKQSGFMNMRLTITKQHM